MANRDRDRDQYQMGGGDYTGQPQMISDDFLSQGSDQIQRSGMDSSYDSNQNRSSRQGSNQYKTNTDNISDSFQGSGGYTNQGSRGSTGDGSFGSSPRYGSENRGSSGLNRMGDDMYSDSNRGCSDNKDSCGGMNQYQPASDRMSDLNQNSGGSYDIKGQATNFLQQTGEQVKNMAQGAADAVKSTLGMNAGNEQNSRYGSSNIGSDNSSYGSNNPSNRV
ncbi:hypothetical protein MLD38_007971 [Melastoma candidum]|uniref:Uncharacterized protein n=1 Tax=Melastoma candidum TaxID=119954 RepID=A0ACB9RUQ9_9MYRT|nr:hypothetical protein MLD38_007971 [Melastoma candidum]